MVMTRGSPSDPYLFSPEKVWNRSICMSNALCSYKFRVAVHSATYGPHIAKLYTAERLMALFWEEGFFTRFQSCRIGIWLKGTIGKGQDKGESIACKEAFWRSAHKQIVHLPIWVLHLHHTTGRNFLPPLWLDSLQFREPPGQPDWYCNTVQKRGASTGILTHTDLPPFHLLFLVSARIAWMESGLHQEE